jgi:hypothetical protein
MNVMAIDWALIEKRQVNKKLDLQALCSTHNNYSKSVN